MRIQTHICFAFVIRSGGSEDMHMLYDLHWRAARRPTARRLSAPSLDIFTPALAASITGRNSKNEHATKGPLSAEHHGVFEQASSSKVLPIPLRISLQAPCHLCWPAAAPGTAKTSLVCPRP